MEKGERSSNILKMGEARLYKLSECVRFGTSTVDGPSRNSTHEIEDLESSERLGERFEEFFDYAICKHIFEFANHLG